MSAAPRLFHRAAALRQALSRGRGSVGFVPTMGALHAGHLSLVRRARREHARVVVSIFVNPTQFGPGEDFSRYPRTLAADLALLKAEGPVAVYAPAVEDVYPAGFASAVSVGGSLGSLLEAALRPGHFTGVATVVARLFQLVKPDQAYFGLKDYQQFQVIRRMSADLGLGLKLAGCPTVREADGLALSSRNRYLSPLDRAKAAALNRALRAAQAAAARGERSGARIEAAGLKVLRAQRGLAVQYFSLADAATLAPLKRLERPARLLTACRLGTTRLIDNVGIGMGGSGARPHGEAKR
jgi:pantoate--beta-alanine ligase